MLVRSVMMSPRWLVAALLVAGFGAEARADHVDWGPFLEKPGDSVKVFHSKPDKPAPVVAEAPAGKSAKSAKAAKKPAPKAKSARTAKKKH